MGEEGSESKEVRREQAPDVPLCMGLAPFYWRLDRCDGHFLRLEGKMRYDGQIFPFPKVECSQRRLNGSNASTLPFGR